MDRSEPDDLSNYPIYVIISKNVIFKRNCLIQENHREFKIKMGEGGRIIIPAVYRKAMHLHSGDELTARFDNGELRLFQQSEALRRIRAAVKSNVKKAIDHTTEFLESRKKDCDE